MLTGIKPFAEFDWISVEDSISVSNMFLRRLWIICLPVLLLESSIAAEPPKSKAPTMAKVLAESKPGDWRPLDPENTLYVEFVTGRVVIELAPLFAPHHVANVKALAREHYFDGLAIVRAQDNYVVQLADPDAEKPELARKIQHAQKTLPAEFESSLRLPFTRLPDGDVYAREVGISVLLRQWCASPEKIKIWRRKEGRGA